MDARMLDLPFDPATRTGLSERLLRSHHQHNYGGAVKRLNQIRTQLRGLEFGAAPGFQLNGLKREELLATNSMRLHELYFDGLGAGSEPMDPALALAIGANFGSVERWRDEFCAVGKALGGGSGWVLLSFQPRDGTLVNQWAADHAHALADGVPLLALDMYEHAYHMDYGAAAGAYVDAFVDNIRWARVHERYRQAVERGSEGFGAALHEARGQRLIDVRRAGVFEQAATMIEGARWFDPQRVDHWAGELATDEPVLVYCVRGHEVSRATAMRLRAAGVDARFLRGGIDAWTAAGLPLQANTPARRDA
jgi:Fe-Mn family superoxide dismutase